MKDLSELFAKIASPAKSTAPITHIVVGLGNPGAEYTYTRHNIGFLSLSYLAKREGASVQKLKFRALVGECTLGDARVLLMMPQTFMNLSGEAVAEAANFYHIPPENIVVISDDVHFDVGRMRIRRNGSAGGHNGLKSIISCLGNDQFPRIKVGVGVLPSPETDLADWVLGKFSQNDLKSLEALYPKIADAILLIVSGKTEEAMCLYSK